VALDLKNNLNNVVSDIKHKNNLNYALSGIRHKNLNPNPYCYN